MPLPSGTAAFLGMPLFIRGHMAASGVVHVGPPVHGSGLPDDSPPLFVRGYLPASGQTTLFIHGWSAASGGPPLCEAGHLTAASGAPLYLYGWSTHSGGLPLVVACDAVPALSGGLDLTVTGGAESGFARGIPLHAYSDPSGNVREGRLPLWVGAFGAQRVPRNVNLWVRGEPHAAGRRPGPDGLERPVRGGPRDHPGGERRRDDPRGPRARPGPEPEPQARNPA
jgi:hypothetical protein